MFDSRIVGAVLSNKFGMTSSNTEKTHYHFIIILQMSIEYVNVCKFIKENTRKELLHMRTIFFYVRAMWKTFQ